MSVKRVQEFLLAEEVEIPSRTNRAQRGISLQNASFFWSASLRRAEEAKRTSKPKSCGCFSRNSAISPATETDETPDETSEPFLLEQINLELEMRQLTAVVGHVGSGRFPAGISSKASHRCSTRFWERCRTWPPLAL